MMTTRRLGTSILLVLLCAGLVHAQLLADWYETYPTNNPSEYSREGWGLTAMPDGGFVMAGEQWTPQGGPVASLIRTDAEGTPIWTRAFPAGGTTAVHLEVVAYIPQGGDHPEQLIAAGRTILSEYRNGGYACAFDLDGTLLWEADLRLADQPRHEAFYDIEVLPDGSVLLVGTRDHGDNPGYNTGRIVRLSATGEVLFDRNVSHGLIDVFLRRIAATPDGTFLVGGEQYDDDDRQPMLLEIDDETNILQNRFWPMTLHGGYVGEVAVAPDGSIYVGIAQCYWWQWQMGFGHYEPVVERLDADLSTIWSVVDSDHKIFFESMYADADGVTMLLDHDNEEVRRVSHDGSTLWVLNYLTHLSEPQRMVPVDDGFVAGGTWDGYPRSKPYLHHLRTYPDDVFLELEPDDTPVIVPAEGGDVTWTTHFSNGDELFFADVRLEVELPSGAAMQTMVQPNRPLPAGVFDVPMSQVVPPGAPAGSYVLRMVIGPPAIPLLMDEFTFTKDGARASGSPGEPAWPQARPLRR